MSKIMRTYATPEEWSSELEHKDVVYDPLHGEMVGYDADDASGPFGEPSFKMDLVGDYAYPELVGDDDSDITQEDIDPPEGVSDFTEPGTPSGGQENIPEDPYNAPPGEVSAADGPVQAILAARAAATIRAKVRAGNPRAVATVKQLAVQARTSPAHYRALKAIAKKPTRKVRRRRASSIASHFMGEVFMGRTVHGTVSQVLSTALTPVAWATHAVGSASNQVGSLLESLARKL